MAIVPTHIIIKIIHRNVNSSILMMIGLWPELLNLLWLGGTIGFCIWELEKLYVNIIKLEMNGHFLRNTIFLKSMSLSVWLGIGLERSWNFFEPFWSIGDGNRKLGRLAGFLWPFETYPHTNWSTSQFQIIVTSLPTM